MIEPPLSMPDGDLANRITQRMLQNQLDQQIIQVVKQGFTRILSSDTIILSRPQRVQLYKQVAQAFLNQIIDNLDQVV